MTRPTAASQLEATAAKHKAWKLALYPVAMKALERGDFDDVRLYREASDWQRQDAAWCFANYAATDLVLHGKTVLLPMDECRAVDPFAHDAEREIAGDRRAA